MAEQYTVCVLMSTYNGEKYIKKQIESILNQKQVFIKLYIRDDGSEDKTLDIINNYAKKGLLTIIPSERNYGPGKSFMEMLYSVDKYEYYAFADQDDIWLQDKLIRAIEKLRLLKSYPALYCSNQIIFRNKINYRNRFKNIPNYSVTNCICGNMISGCTMVFNSNLKILLTSYKASDEVLKLRMHDVWVLSVALLTGKVIYDKHSYILYRIHSENTVGLRKRNLKFSIEKFINAIKNKKYNKGRSLLAKNLMVFENMMTKENRELVQAFANYDSNLKNKIRLIKNKKIQAEIEENRGIFIFKTIIGWH